MRGGFLLILAISLLFFSCGYNFTCKKELPFGVDKIFVNMFTNSTEEIGLGSQVTNEFIKYVVGRIPGVIVDKSNADAVIDGEVVSLYIENFSDSLNSSTTKHIVLTVKFRLQSPEGLILWSSDQIREAHVYSFVSDNVDLRRDNKEKAIATLVEKLSALIFQTLTEQF